MDLSNNIPSLENKTLEYLMNPNQYDRLVKKHIEKMNFLTLGPGFRILDLSSRFRGGNLT